MSKFTKGQIVYLIQSWDDKGTFYYSKHVVGSCGTKRMHLLHMDGKTLMHRLYPQYINCAESGGPHVFAALEGFDPEDKALELAGLYLPAERARMQNCISSACAHSVADGRYVKSMNAKIAELHEPRALDRDAM